MCFLRNKVLLLIIIIIIIIIIISSLNFERKTNVILTLISHRNKKCHLGQPFTETDFWHKRQL